MRKVFCLAALALLPGCSGLPTIFGGPTASVGWRVEVGTPSTLTVPATAVVHQGSGPSTAIPVTAALAAGPAVAGPVFAAADPCAPAGLAVRGPVFAQRAADGCTLQDVCAKLDVVINRLPPPPQRLPAGPPAKEE